MSFCTRSIASSSTSRLFTFNLSRAFTSTRYVAAKQSTEVAKAEKRARTMLKSVNPEAMTIAEAAAVLRAVEVATPWSAYELHIVTRYVKGQTPPRGRVNLPRDPRTKEERILVFAEGRVAREVKKLGAAYVGGLELVPDILSGKITPTKVFCTPSLITPITPKLARFLGPKGLMPSTRRGTVTDDIVGSIKQAQGKLDWRSDKMGVIRAPIGRVHFPIEDLETNVRVFLDAVKASTADTDTTQQQKRAPASILQVHLSSRQGPGIQLLDV